VTQAASTFRFQLKVPLKVELEDQTLGREDFFAWLWDRFGTAGLVGVHEGSVLSEQAAEQGFETESFTVDAAEAPRERDWIGAQIEASAVLFFASHSEAQAAHRELKRWVESDVTEEKPQDWDAEWKKSFLNASDGVFIEPFWRILPAWVERELPAGERPLRINPGAGFGTGTHETTQLCLRVIGEFAKGGPHLLVGQPVLDFGSGSGILAIGAALLGAEVDAVEIDELAIDNALENARINGVETRISYSRQLDPKPMQYPLVIANILRPVLIQFAPELVKRLAPGGCLILSGLMQGDVPEIVRVFSALLGVQPEIRELGEWRGVVWVNRR
jgi:ribosomal protein L11 methyltransferase